MAIIIEAAHQPAVAGPGHARRVQPGAHRIEKSFCLVRQEGIDIGRAVGDGPVARVLAVQDAQRVLLQALLRVFGQLAAMRLEMVDQRGAPCLTAVAVAQRVELQRHAIGNTQLVQQLVGHRQQFHIGLRLGGTDDLRIDLVELAIAALLRPFVTE